MKGQICLCPASIAWIRKHLMKSARRTFTKMLSVGSIKKVTTSHRKKRFSAKQLAAQRLFSRRAKAGTLNRAFGQIRRGAKRRR